ncbi:hypothetical protein SRABI76_02752 [Microbacterium oxydans]|uniref:Uncharacterized protein n=1 Tax=Microbacterium oxydans TaxID=82380 RepID=A0A0F0L8R3_9MICO|nr:DUF6301 family protein [Microbacterium oxydans]KJL29079.1 hypothetical protein RS83_01704 [Microbacterium oxydans]CAH0231009.1 hypothetical protein SRABI76_02752 [Microbacterium oxydans]
MTALGRATDAQIDSFCDAFTSVSWPLGRVDFHALAEGLGWSLKLETSSGVQHRSGYPVNLPTVRSLATEEAVSQVTVAVSDKSDDPRGLRCATLELQSALGGRLGPRSGSSEDGDHYWELGNGGRIWLRMVPKKVLLVVEEQRFADVERREERMGIRP